MNVLLPPVARAVGVQVRWWQPQHNGADSGDWALDNVLITGLDMPVQMFESFGAAAPPNNERAPAYGSLTVNSKNDQEEETHAGVTQTNK